MAKNRTMPAAPESVISIVGAGMRITGDCESADTIRIEGMIEGTVRAEKGVVIGRNGRVNGDIHTADARIAGSVKGALVVESRLEIEATAVVDGEIQTARLQLEEGGIVNGKVAVGRKDGAAATPPVEKGADAKAPGPNGTLFGTGKTQKANK